MSPLGGTLRSGTLSRMARPLTMMLVVASGIDAVIEYRSAAGQTLGRSQNVKGVGGLSREGRGLDEDTSALSGCLSPGSRCINADA